MKVTLILPVYNSLITLEKCLDSIFAQSFKDWQLIIIDDGSVDGSTEIIEKIKSEKVIILKNNRNRGLPYSINKCIPYCDTAFIARVDADDVQHKDRLFKQVNYLCTHPEVDMVSTFAFAKKNREYIKLSVPTTHKEISKTLIKRNCILHPTVMFKKEFFEKYGLYDESFLRAQDYELWLRALKKGAIFGCIDECLVYYNTNEYVRSIKTLFIYTVCRIRIFFRYPTLSSIFFILADITKPYFYKLRSMF